MKCTYKWDEKMGSRPTRKIANALFGYEQIGMFTFGDSFGARGNEPFLYYQFLAELTSGHISMIGNSSLSTRWASCAFNLFSF